MAHPDLQALYDSLLPFSKKLLCEQGGLSLGGAYVFNWRDPMDSDYGEELPEAPAFIDMLAGTFPPQSRSGVLRAIGICYDARVRPPGQSDKSDAICRRLEHRSGSGLKARMAVPDGSS